jgi:hypothetical protein
MRLRESRAHFRPRFAINFLTLNSESAGNAGRSMRPIAARAEVQSTRVSQVTLESPSYLAVSKNSENQKLIKVAMCGMVTPFSVALIDLPARAGTKATAKRRTNDGRLP